MDKLLFKRVLLGLLCVGIVAYIIYLFASFNFSRAVETEEAVTTTVSDTIYSDAFIIRNESYITNNLNGVLSFNVSDGDNISKDEIIADVYNNEKDAVSMQKIKKVKQQIKKLKALSESYYKNSVSLDTINAQINNGIFSIASDVNNEDFSGAKSLSQDLLLSISERQMITGSAKNFNTRISELRNQESKLESESSDSIGTVVAPNAGYFSSSVDGYEKSFNCDKLKKIYPGSLKNIKSKTPENDTIGKVITDPEWYIACKVSADDTVMLSKVLNEGRTINVNMPSVTTQTLPAEIYSINQRDRKDDAVLILTCDYMNNFIATARKEPVEITAVSYEGLKVSKRAIHEGKVTKKVKDKDTGKYIEKSKTVQGVYVLHGSELIFKEISIVYSASDYVLCNPEPQNGVLFSDETLQLYDQVVIKGDDLYDGKVIR